MQPSQLVCSRCGHTATPGTRYCANCGEAVDPALVAELRDLYTVLTTLTAEVDAGRGAAPVEHLRDAIRARYLRLRTTPDAAPVGVAVAPALPVAPGAPAMPVPTIPLSRPRAAAAPASPPAPVRPPRPAFSWRAFLSEQAIAIMAYLGAFLLLVATLAFELGGWQALSDGIKLTVVLVVYIAFGALGTSLRRMRDLRTVSSAYLGIFALMTPLVALAVYRFALRSSGFPVAGMICIGAAYAAVVYLALALRTDFAVYAYLGWLAAGVAVVEALVWGKLDTSLALYFLALFALALLFPAMVGRWQVAARLGGPARDVALLASAIPLLAIVLSALGELSLTLAGDDVRHESAL
ncbi:MAG TPA: zinc ribbon domain-containing protein, partial [Ktedonobacterales bacterium]